MKENLRQEVAALKAEGIEPTLGIIRVGSRPDDVYYENNIIKNCENVGIATISYPLDLSISMEEFTAVMTQVNHNRSVHGIMTV